MESSNEYSNLLGHDYSNQVHLDVHSSAITLTESTTKVEFKIYKRRWYILFVFTAQALIYNMTWNTWGPIQVACKIAFGWTDFNIILLSSWAAISVLITSVPLIWLMDRKGLRIPVLLIAFLSVLGKCLQVIPFNDNKVRTIFMNLGQFLVMSGGPVALGAPPLVSATWFPASERTTATAIASLVGYFGMAIAFAVGPAVVHNEVVESTVNDSSAPEEIKKLAKILNHQITQYTYFEVGLSAAVFLCILLYFPSTPPLPPSLTSSRSHTESTRASFRRVMKNGQFWLLITLAGFCFGLYFGWLSMLNVFLAKFSVDSTTAGWLGCGASLSGVVSGILLARYADFAKYRKKQILILLLILSTISQLIFTLSCEGILPSTKVLLFSSIICGGFVYNGTSPLFLELIMECAYPVGEGFAGGLSVTVSTVVLLVFYVAFMLPHSDVRWMNWVTVGGVGVCVLGLFIYREKYTRLDLDACAEPDIDLGNTSNYKSSTDAVESCNWLRTIRNLMNIFL